jgi:hypothetical protein
MALKVKATIVETNWINGDLIVAFVVEPHGFPIQGGSFVIPATSLNASQLTSQFKGQLLDWVAANPEYAGLGSVAQTELVLIGALA